MSKEILDYQKLCSNYYSSWEEGCCMESCEFYNHNECPVVYVNGLLEERDKTIADLEAKLAEKDKAIENWQTMYQSVMQSCHNSIEEDKRLREQLAEKDAEIQSWKDGTMVVKLCELEKQLAEKEKELEEVKKSKTYIMNFGDKVKEVQVVDDNQDKISFALEQLTQAKEYIKNSLENMWNGNGEMTCRDRNIIDGIYTKLDEQIEELTHQHEDKGE
jgi:chromosome segregation ATPase